VRTAIPLCRSSVSQVIARDIRFPNVAETRWFRDAMNPDPDRIFRPAYVTCCPPTVDGSKVHGNVTVHDRTLATKLLCCLRLSPWLRSSSFCRSMNLADDSISILEEESWVIANCGGSDRRKGVNPCSRHRSESLKRCLGLAIPQRKATDLATAMRDEHRKQLVACVELRYLTECDHCGRKRSKSCRANFRKGRPQRKIVRMLAHGYPT